jgi:hypothetical protein
MEECSLMQVDRCFSPAMRPLRNGGVVKFLEIGSGQACCMQKSHVPVHANNDHRQTTQTIRVHRLTCKIEGLWRTEEDVRTMYPDARSKLPLDRARKCRYQPIMSIDGVFVCGVDRGGWISDFDSSWHLQPRHPVLQQWRRLYSISNQPAPARVCRPLASTTVRDDCGYRRLKESNVLESTL